MTTTASAASAAVRPDPDRENWERQQELIKRIKDQYAAVTDATKNIVNRAIALGESLIEAKTACGHGNFLQWLQTNCGISDKTAQRYMKALRLVGVKVGGGGGGGGSATYDELEERLVKKLKDLPPEELDDHVEGTYKTLKTAADEILADKAREKKAA